MPGFRYLPKLLVREGDRLIGGWVISLLVKGTEVSFLLVGLVTAEDDLTNVHVYALYSSHSRYQIVWRSNLLKLLSLHSFCSAVWQVKIIIDGIHTASKFA